MYCHNTSNIGAFMIRIGFWGIFYYNYNKGTSMFLAKRHSFQTIDISDLLQGGRLIPFPGSHSYGNLLILLSDGSLRKSGSESKSAYHENVSMCGLFGVSHFLKLAYNSCIYILWPKPQTVLPAGVISLAYATRALKDGRCRPTGCGSDASPSFEFGGWGG